MPVAAFRGSDGIMSPTPCICPEWCVAQWRAWQAGDLAQATSLHRKVMAVVRWVTAHPMPVGWKAALHLLGFGSDRPALPLRPLEADALAALRQGLAEVGLLGR